MFQRFFQGPLREENDLPDSGGSKTAVIEEKPEKKGKEDDAAALRKEIEARDKRIRELETSERHWADKAKRTEATDDDEEDDTPPAKDDDDDEFDDPAALLEGLTKNGKVTLSKIIDRYVKKNGLITAKQAQELAANMSAEAVAKAEKRLSSDAKLMREVGDEINDPKSPLFQRTAAIFQDMVRDDPQASKSPAMLRAAARTAKAELAAEGKTEKTAKRAPIEDEDDADESERERRARVNAQQGDRGKGGSFENDDEIGEDTKRVMRLMNIDEKRGIDIIRKDRAGKRRSA